jgi:hypothetical protein
MGLFSDKKPATFQVPRKNLQQAQEHSKAPFGKQTPNAEACPTGNLDGKSIIVWLRVSP